MKPFNPMVAASVDDQKLETFSATAITAGVTILNPDPNRVSFTVGGVIATTNQVAISVRIGGTVFILAVLTQSRPSEVFDQARYGIAVRGEIIATRISADVGVSGVALRSV